MLAMSVFSVVDVLNGPFPYGMLLKNPFCKRLSTSSSSYGSPRSSSKVLSVPFSTFTAPIAKNPVPSLLESPQPMSTVPELSGTIVILAAMSCEVSPVSMAVLVPGVPAAAVICAEKTSFTVCGCPVSGFVMFVTYTDTV